MNRYKLGEMRDCCHFWYSRVMQVSILLYISGMLFSVWAVTYQTVDDVVQRYYGDGVTLQHCPLVDKAGMKAITVAARDKSRGQLQSIQLCHRDNKVLGVLFLDQVIGRTEYITWSAMLKPNGDVLGIDVLVYREPIGSAVRTNRFRKQFIGKTAKDRIRIRRDIRNIAGSTMSCKAITERTRFITRYFATHGAALLDGFQAEVVSTKIQSFPLGTVRCEISSADQSVPDALQQLLTTLHEQESPWSQTSSWHQLHSQPSQHGLAVVAEGIRWFNLSAGVLDLSAGPLWRAVTSKEGDVQAAQALLCMPQLRIDQRSIHMPDAVQLDPSFLWKGYCVDTIRRHQVEDAAWHINLGGSLWYQQGLDPIAVQLPDAPQALSTHPLTRISSGQALAVSASWNQAGPHLVNPVLGSVVTDRRYALVQSSSAAEADALSTFLCIVGWQQAQTLLYQLPHVRAVLWDAGQVHTTPSSEP